MKINKRAFTFVLSTIFCVSIFAQEQSVVRKTSSTQEKSKAETSVEQEYLSDVEGVVILGLAASDEYDNKLVAMQFLESAVENGNVSDDIMKALNQLAGEGISKQSRTNGRLMNNFPDIRRRACLALGKIKTEQSKEYLGMFNNDKEVLKYIEKVNKLRGNYYKYYTGKSWDDARNYDLCLNSGVLGFEKTVEEIKAYLKVRFGEDIFEKIK